MNPYFNQPMINGLPQFERKNDVKVWILLKLTPVDYWKQLEIYIGKKSYCVFQTCHINVRNKKTDLNSSDL